MTAAPLTILLSGVVQYGWEMDLANWWTIPVGLAVIAVGMAVIVWRAYRDTQ